MTVAPTPSDDSRELLRRMMNAPTGCANVTDHALKELDAHIAARVKELQGNAKHLSKIDIERGMLPPFKILTSEEVQSVIDESGKVGKNAAPTPRDGERDLELAVAQLGVVIDWLKEDAGFHVSKAAKRSLGEVFTDMIAASFAQRVAEAVGPLEKELAKAKEHLKSTVANEEFCSEWISRIATIVGVHPDRLLFMEETESAVRLYKDALTASEKANAALEAENRALRDLIKQAHAYINSHPVAPNSLFNLKEFNEDVCFELERERHATLAPKEGNAP